MDNNPIVIDLDDEDDYIQIPARSPSPSTLRHGPPVMAHIPENVLRSPQPQQMPPPSRITPLTSRINAARPADNGNASTTQTTQFMQSVTTTNTTRTFSNQSGSNTTVNVIVCAMEKRSPLWDVPAFTRMDDETSSVQYLGAIRNAPHSKSKSRIQNRHEKAKLPATSTNTATANANDNENFINPATPLSANIMAQKQFLPGPLMTPPASPAHISSSRRSTSTEHRTEESESQGEIMTIRIGQKRPAHADESVAGTLPGPSKRIAPIPTENTKEKGNSVPVPSASSSSSIVQPRKTPQPYVIQQEARVVVESCPEAEEILKNSIAAAVTPTLTSSSTPTPTSTSSSTLISSATHRGEVQPKNEILLKELHTAESMLMASFAAYVHQRLAKKYDLSKVDDIQKAIEKMKEANKYMQPGKNQVRETFRLIQSIDSKSYDKEIAHLIEKQELVKAEREKDEELAKIVKELEQYESRMTELDNKTLFQPLTFEEKSEYRLLVATLSERYTVYEKLRGKGNEVFFSLHKNKFKKIELEGTYPQITAAVEKFLDERRKDILKGFHEGGWDEMYPDFHEMLKVVQDAASLYKIGGTVEHFKRITAQLYDCMTKRLRDSRGLDYLDNFDVWVGCSKETVASRLENDPANSSVPLPIILETNATTAKSNMELKSEMFQRKLERSLARNPCQDDEDEDISDDDDDYYDPRWDVETESDLEFIDDSPIDDLENFSSSSQSSIISNVSISSSVTNVNEARDIAEFSRQVPGPSRLAYSPSSAVHPTTSTSYLSQTFFTLNGHIIYSSDEEDD